MTDILPSRLIFGKSREDSLPDETGREIQILRSGSTHFGIFSEVVKTVAEWQQPAQLPHAPKGLIGVVGIRGHILTLLDPLILLGKDEYFDYSSGKILALRGDEQLGLAVQEVIDTIWLQLADIEPPTQNHSRRLVITHFNHQRATVLLLNEKELFAAAMQGRERRRRRF